MEVSAEIQDLLNKLDAKYAQTGQGLKTYLELLLESDYVNYWDYIQLETLLSLQRPRTTVPDETIFVVYHQITELYFKLVLHEIDQLAAAPADALLLQDKLFRINQYFEALTHSFGVMENGMSRDQFLQFRQALVPASGFQSMQYRIIEMGSTPFVNLVHKTKRNQFHDACHIEDMYPHLYWMRGATVEDTGEKAFTLQQFESKYGGEFIAAGHFYKGNTLWDKYKQLPAEAQENHALQDAFRLLDLNVNVYWPLQHYKTAVRYLAGTPDTAATGGTNWRKYLPPRFQQRVFYPELWSAQQLEDWGKGWVEDVVKNLRETNK